MLTKKNQNYYMLPQIMLLRLPDGNSMFGMFQSQQNALLSLEKILIPVYIGGKSSIFTQKF
jgi:hypothetical protein